MAGQWKADEETLLIRSLRWGALVIAGLFAMGLVGAVMKRVRGSQEPAQESTARPVAPELVVRAQKSPRKKPEPIPTSDPFAMDWETADRYLKSLGYRSVRDAGEDWLRADDERCDIEEECRSRLPSIIFHYKVRNASGPACFSFIQMPGFDWKPIVQLVKPLDGETERLERAARKARGGSGNFSGRIRCEAGEMDFHIRDERSVIILGPYCQDFL